MAVRLAEWTQVCAMYINGVPIPALEDAVRSAAIEFCQKTRVDTRTWKELPYVANEPDTVLPSPDSRVVVCEAINVWANGVWVRPRTRPEIDLKYSDQSWVLEEVGSFEEVWGWISLRPNRVRLIPAVTLNSFTALTVEAAMQPIRTATLVEDYLFDIHGERIGWGALARMHSHVNAPYANPEYVAGFRAAFDNAISEVAEQFSSGNNKPQLRTLPDSLT